MALGLSWSDVGIGVLVPSYLVTKGTKEAADKIIASDFFQKNVCPMLRSAYVQAAQQDASKAPDAKAQAANAAVQYAQAGCTQPLPTSETLPSGLPPAPRPRDETLHREFIQKPFYKKRGFWIGVGLVAAAGAGAYYILR